MPLPRFQKLRPEQQENILREARAEFADRGFEGASLNRIIAGSGMSKGAMYYYFADKTDLFVTVCVEVLHEFGREMPAWRAPSDEESFWDQVHAVSSALTVQIFARPDLIPLGRAMYAAPAGPRDEIIKTFAGWVGTALESGQRVGAVRTDLPLTLLVEAVTGLLVGVDRWFALHWAELGPEAIQELEPKLFELARDLVRPRPTRNPTRAGSTPKKQRKRD